MNRRALLAALAAAPLAACATTTAQHLIVLPASDTVVLQFSDAYRYLAVGAAIEVATGCWADHVDLVLPDSRLLGAVPEGVNIRPAAHPAWVRAERYAFAGPSDVVLGYALRQIGKPYDLLANIGYATHTGVTLGHLGWNCSRLVAASALKGGVDLAPGRSPARTAPADLLRSPLLRRVA